MMSHQNHSFFSFEGILFTFMKNFKIIYETATVSKKQKTYDGSHMVPMKMTLLFMDLIPTKKSVFLSHICHIFIDINIRCITFLIKT